MRDLSRLHFYGGLVGLVFLALISVLGLAPGTDKSETVPVSVRDNPTSYRAAYIGFFGYTARPTAGSGGGYRVGK